MDAPTRQWQLRTAIFGLAYFVVGIVSAALAASTASDQTRLHWRLAAWLASGLLYLSHLVWEHFRLRNSARLIACHVAIAVAIGAFGLALAAAVHSLTTSHYRSAYLFALIAWPAITAVPAFLVTLAVASLLARFARR